MARLLVIGGGRMGEALVAGLVDSGWAPAEEIVVVEALASRRDELAAAHPGLDVRAARGYDGFDTVLAVKPADAVASLVGSGPGAGCSRSPPASPTARPGGGPARRHARRAGHAQHPGPGGRGAAAIAGGAHATDDDLAWAEEILGAVGTVVRVPEAQLDAVTGLSGSGPAYVFLVAEALIDAGVLVGLPRPASRELAVQTLLGAARLLAETGETPEALRAQVTSPGGTTAAGLRALEAGGVRSAVVDAVVAATERSRELGQ